MNFLSVERLERRGELGACDFLLPTGARINAMLSDSAAPARSWFLFPRWSPQCPAVAAA